MKKVLLILFVLAAFVAGTAVVSVAIDDPIFSNLASDTISE